MSITKDSHPVRTLIGRFGPLIGKDTPLLVRIDSGRLSI
jgi:hypothetical protein